MDCSYPNWDRVSITLKARKAADLSAAFLAFSVILTLSQFGYEQSIATLAQFIHHIDAIRGFVKEG